MEDNQPSTENTPSQKISTPVPAVSNAIALSEWKAAMNGVVENCRTLDEVTKKAKRDWPKKDYRINMGSAVYSRDALHNFMHEWVNATNEVYAGILSLEDGEPIANFQKFTNNTYQRFSDRAAFDELRATVNLPLEENHLTAEQQKTANQALDTIDAVAKTICKRIEETSLERVASPQRQKE